MDIFISGLEEVMESSVPLCLQMTSNLGARACLGEQGCHSERPTKAGGRNHQEPYQSQRGQMKSPALGRQSCCKGTDVQFGAPKLRKNLNKPGWGQGRLPCWLGLEPLTCKERLWEQDWFLQGRGQLQGHNSSPQCLQGGGLRRWSQVLYSSAGAVQQQIMRGLEWIQGETFSPWGFQVVGSVAQEALDGDWKKSWTFPSDFQAGPALGRRLNRRPPEVPSNMNSVIL